MSYPFINTNVVMVDTMPFAFSSNDSDNDLNANAGAKGKFESEALRGKQLVIVEDEAITQIQLRKICQRAGMTVAAVAADGRSGLKAILEHRPDIVLMDIKMPVMDGFDAAEMTLKEFAACIVLLTAYDIEEYQQRAREIGVSGYILKPVTSQNLVPQIEAAFREFTRKAQ
jgi:YesN/AraC family two-component response regulator